MRRADGLAMCTADSDVEVQIVANLPDQADQT